MAIQVRGHFQEVALSFHLVFQAGSLMFLH